MSTRLGLALVVVCFCIPLFVDLGQEDLQNDESIYSFAVDRMLETGDWLVPRLSPSEDAAFLEKPPLKFWIVAGSIRLGLLPHNEFGLRFWDALFGSVAFLYVYAFGCSLAGSVCGVVAVLTLFVFRQLLFDHGLRSNNMEGPLFLCYCGGIYHYLRWMSARRGAGSIDAAAAMLYFILGFMTKFVAALFLPLVLGAATLLIRRYRERFVQERKAIAIVSAVGAAMVVPWFLYAYSRFGSGVWEIMLKSHVFVRMTTALDPSHVQPWTYYGVNLYRSFSYSGAAPLVFGGFLLLAVQSFRRRWEAGFLALLWFAIPIVLISLGTSKLIHYAYPFLPPLALGAGYLAALVLQLATGELAFVRWPRVPTALTAVVIALIVVATVVAGELRVDWGGLTLFKSTALLRPALLGLAAAVLATGWRHAPRVAAVVLVAILLPLSAYAQNLGRLDEGQSPLRTMRDCLVNVQRQNGGLAGFYVDVPESEMEHPIYYYFRRVQPWWRAQSNGAAPVDVYLNDPLTVRPVLLAESEYQEFLHGEHDGRAALNADVAIVSFDDLFVFLPGPYGACRPAVTAFKTSR